MAVRKIGLIIVGVAGIFIAFSGSGSVNIADIIIASAGASLIYLGATLDGNK